MKKRLVSIFLAVLLTFALAVPASAATTGKWNFSISQAHVQQTIARMISQYGWPWGNN